MSDMKDDLEGKKKSKGEKYSELKLYCQSCCARYTYCEWKDTLHAYDRCSETCPDYLPKDIYKAVNPETLTVTNEKSSCYRKRLSLDPDFRPLPENIPLSFWTKEQLENAKEYALKKMKEEKQYEEE